MTLGKAGLITAGLVGVVALGVATGPTIQKNWSRMDAPVTPAVETSATSAPQPATARPARRARSSSPRTHDVAAVKTVKKESNTIETIAVSMWEPEFRDRVKAVLNPGAKPEIAAANFASAEQFMTVAHAARNTQVPFMVLKDRVLNQGQSLAQAIHEFKPDLDARAEVTRAHAAAREDIESAG
jgi:hypothetical protein